jgi:hypothetical protein
MWGLSDVFVTLERGLVPRFTGLGPRNTPSRWSGIRKVRDLRSVSDNEE